MDAKVFPVNRQPICRTPSQKNGTFTVKKIWPNVNGVRRESRSAIPAIRR